DYYCCSYTASSTFYYVF
nr:immunoglobulin light chain junction region [Macaca mulatta]MOX43282.1 immunoglobulin light chain junction region [Macaca mulatta]MOX43494.1 immunoglobulin light chain junction region [Macaca mulatta]MOX43642.1 immunoglobulin light chain junction region [Macaca mulatta]MOX43744.1 immunoglobulin light chain junction region [Macaca mulatta]